MTSPDELLALASDIALEAGELARRRREEGVTVAATKSALADIVTEADREVEALIRARLDAARPGDAFLGEESGADGREADITWVVDPIDGTVNYAYGLPEWAVSIAAVAGSADPAEWEALAGVVYCPATGDVFAASREGGAWLGERRIRTNAEVGPAGGLIATGFGYDPATHAAALDELARVMPIARDIRRAGAASLDLAAVAAGRHDAYYERGLNPWDHAAGALLVAEAGGIVSGAPGDRPGNAMTIAASPGIYYRLVEVLDF